MPLSTSGAHLGKQDFFEYDDVKVTNASCMTCSHEVRYNSVTSVKTKIDKPSRLSGIYILVDGLGIAVNAPAVGIAVVAVVAAAAAAAAALYLYIQKMVYHAMLTRKNL